MGHTQITGHPTLLARLVARAIDSAVKVEIVVFLYESGHEPRTISALAAVVGQPVEAIRATVYALRDAGVISASGPHGDEWQLDPDSEWAPSVTALAVLYREAPGDLRELISRCSSSV